MAGVFYLLSEPTANFISGTHPPSIDFSGREVSFIYPLLDRFPGTPRKFLDLFPATENNVSVAHMPHNINFDILGQGNHETILADI